MSNKITELGPPPPVDESSFQTDEIFRHLVESVEDYAIFLLSPEGKVMTWNSGAERIKGYSASEIIGRNFSTFYAQEARESGWPQRELEIAADIGRFADEGWRVRKDGSTFWASVVITALRNRNTGALRGFSKVTRDLSERRALEERTQELNKELRSRMAQLSESRTQLELRTLELQRLSGQLVHIQDEERRRIARELHDDLGQILVALNLNLAGSPQFESRNEAVELTETALAKVRTLSYVLHPPLLDESGLLPALHLYIEGFKKRSDLRISFDYKPSPFPRLDRDLETSIFRVIQEAITNIHRHAHSPDARVEIHQQTDRVLLRVRDFGVGIPVDSATGNQITNTGVGIGSMKERIKQLGGDMSILRAEPGTIVEASIPLFQ
ncbi:MAG TPA: PAS domain-containing sensor histidine kinase [Candidatus Sulfotelmatobacter sp.]|jgi:PAS domain S-box-containing protein